MNLAKHTYYVLAILLPISSTQATAVYNPPEIKYPESYTATDFVDKSETQERELASTLPATPAPSLPNTKDPANTRYELPHKDEVERNIASNKQDVKEDGLAPRPSRFQEVLIETPHNWPWDK